MPRKITPEDLVTHLAFHAQDGRVLCALAGPPGVGKTTIAKRLSTALNDAGTPTAILQMDGFHYDNRYLEPAGLLPRKGAPETFDVGGLAHTLARLRSNTEAHVAVPQFDRSIETARAGATLIPKGAHVILVEGNYLLLNLPPWNALAKSFDVSVMLDARLETLRARLIQRWEDASLPPEEIAAKVEGNDLKNAETVLTQSAEADYVLVTEDS